MNDLAIRVEGLSKKYRIGGRHEGYRTLRETLTDAVVSPFRKAGKLLRGQAPSPVLGAMRFAPCDKGDFWALKDISFEVKQGEVVGIIGRNGAGKSTLLKILSRITEPTEGYVDIYGRVGSLLEVGTGFHSELTGRENIFLNGAILGMKKLEINQKFDEIVAFAEVEKFIDTPVKHYSTGMYLRLAFAVAAHLEPEILLVDEVLAVGDAQFQKKCLGKMGDVAKEGRTVLFVSHNMEAVENLCSSAILLNNGKILFSGTIQETVRYYISQSLSSQHFVEWKDLAQAPGNDRARLVKAEVRAFNKNPAVFYSDAPFEFEFIFFNNLSGSNNLDVTYHLVNERGILVYVGSTAYSRKEYFPRGLIKAICHVPAHLLNEGTYTINRFLLVKDRGHIVYEHRDLLTFDVVNRGSGDFGWVGQKEGVIKPNLEWELSYFNS